MDKTKKSRALSWDDLANLYQKHTGKTARIRPMEEVAEWAESRTDIIEVRRGYFYLK